MKPYLLRPDGPGKAYVVDRASSAVVGWVVSDHYGNWDGWIYTPQFHVQGWYRYRADAAAAVWEATR